MTLKGKNSYTSRNSQPCTGTIKLRGWIVYCDLEHGHKGSHETELRDLNDKVFVLDWRPKRGEN